MPGVVEDVCNDDNASYVERGQLQLETSLLCKLRIYLTDIQLYSSEAIYSISLQLVVTLAAYPHKGMLTYLL
jgi:hypothetical protein